jgi:hypothetical protein
MGPIYLRRLLFLHAGRTERLKTLLHTYPIKHTPTSACDAVDQRKNLETLWRDAVRSLAWEANANPSLSILHTELSSIVDKLPCLDCQIAAKERIRQILVEWTQVKQTI